MPVDKNALTEATRLEPESNILGPGDVALLLKADGSVQALTFGYDRSRLLRPESEWTEEDRAMVKQGQKLFALSFAADHPQIMQTLLDIVADPDVVDVETLRAATVKH